MSGVVLSIVRHAKEPLTPRNIALEMLMTRVRWTATTNGFCGSW
jgi:hypothetical protein